MKSKRLQQNKKIGIGLLGLGTVGQGVVDVLRGPPAARVASRAGAHLDIVQVAVRDLSTPRDCDTQGLSFTTDTDRVIHNPAVDIVVELMGGTGDALEAVLSALKAGKVVVTANKALIALHGEQVFSVSRKNATPILYEAAVAGGIPIIKVLREAMDANQILAVAGIVNGTCNYVLSKMEKEKLPFATALQQAQKLGYAEADFAFDTQGTDAAHKIAILAALAFGQQPRFDKVYTEGIERVTLEDHKQVNKMGYRIKHLAIAGRTGDCVNLRVHPALIPKHFLLATVDGAMNAVSIVGDVLGESVYYGAGAGRLPTASAVVADICEAARHLCWRSLPPGFLLNGAASLRYTGSEAIRGRYYIRLDVDDVPGVLHQVAAAMANHEISIEFIHQEEPQEEGGLATVFILTNVVNEKQVTVALQELGGCVDLRCEPFFIRVFEHPA